MYTNNFCFFAGPKYAPPPMELIITGSDAKLKYPYNNDVEWRSEWGSCEFLSVIWRGRVGVGVDVGVGLGRSNFRRHRPTFIFNQLCVKSDLIVHSPNRNNQGGWYNNLGWGVGCYNNLISFNRWVLIPWKRVDCLSKHCIVPPGWESRYSCIFSCGYMLPNTKWRGKKIKIKKMSKKTKNENRKIKNVDKKWSYFGGAILVDISGGHFGGQFW